jgi:ABC-type Na+ transport system ATPase subunit NatA
LIAHLKVLEQRETNIPKRSRQHEIIKLRAEINQLETKRTTHRINKTRSCFSEKINKIYTPLAKLTRGYRDSIQINKIINQKGDTEQKPNKSKKSSGPTTNSCTQQKLENLDEMDNFLD